LNLIYETRVKQKVLRVLKKVENHWRM